jgi:hypothetical protein
VGAPRASWEVERDMATRRATRQYNDLMGFLNDYNATIKDGSIFLPADSYRGELSAELKLDLVLPVVGRVGPIPAQVIQRAPAGTALQLTAIPPDVQEGFEKVFTYLDEVKAYLISTGSVVDREEVEAQLAALREEAAEAIAAAEAAAEARLAAEREAAAARAQAAAQVAGTEPSGVAVVSGVGSPAADTPRPRGIPIPSLAGVAPALTGSMSDRSFRDLTLQLAVDKLRGLITITYPDGRMRYGYWDRGGPVAWRSEPIQEGEVLGVLLYRSKQLTREQLAESLEMMEDRNIRQGEALIEMGVMSFSQLIMVLGKQVDFILQQVMSERQGSWAFYPMDDLPEKFLPPPLRVPSLLYRGLFSHARSMRGSELQAVHASRLNSYVSLSEDAKEVLTEIKFSSSETRFLEVLQSNSWRLRELFSVSPLSKAVTAAMLWALEEMSFLEYQKSEDSGRTIARISDRVLSKRKQVARGSLFDVLEIHWICLPTEIEKAHQKMRAEFDLSDSPVKLPNDVLVASREIVAKIDEALSTLKPELSRREYRKKIVEPMMIMQSAELLSKKGEMAIMRQDRREACGCFAKALELVPGHPEFRDGLRRSTALL